jgi:4-hydroxy-tetrahydrodipicolinate synthase
MIDHERIAEIRGRIRGPVNSIYTTFTKDGELDWPGIRQLIDNGIESGSEISLLTFGDSQLDFLTDQEVAELTNVLVEQSAGRSLTVAATKRWSTRTAMEFAEYCKGIGVDILMMLPSDHAFSAEGRIRWYRQAAEILPVMIVGFPAWPILDGVKDEPRICAFKEDGTLNYTIDMLVRYPNQWAYITGGTYKRHLAEWPYGVESYFCWGSGFASHVARGYWSAIQANDVAAAAKIVRETEAPFYGLLEKYPDMFQDVIRGALELNGVAQRYLRAPRRSLTDQELEEVASVLKPLGLMR